MSTTRTMKRQQQRIQVKKNTRFNISEEELKLIIEKALEEERAVRKKAINETSNCIASAFFMSLHDTFGFGQKRLERLHNKTLSIFNDVVDGHLTVDDIQSRLKNKGVDFKLIGEGNKGN